MSAQHTPTELPAVPTGWKRSLCMHLNFGSEGGAATYSIVDAEGRETVIVYQYDTRKPKPALPAVGRRKAKPAIEPAPTGYHVPSADTDVYPNWAALHAAWPSIVEKLATGAAS